MSLRFLLLLFFISFQTFFGFVVQKACAVEQNETIASTELIDIPLSFYKSSDAILKALGLLDLLNPYQNSHLIIKNEYFWVVSEPHNEILNKALKIQKLEGLTRQEALFKLGVNSEQELQETIPLQLVEIYYVGLDEVPQSGDDEHFKSLMIMANQTYAVRIYLQDGRMCLIQSISDGAIHGILFDGSDEFAKAVKGAIIRPDGAIFNYVYDPQTGQPSFHKK